MAETPSARLWTMRLTYLGLVVVILFFKLLPLETTPRGWAAPDFLLALTFAWALRRPDFVPALAIALAFLFADFLLHRPPGLMATLVLIAATWLKGAGPQLRDEGFVNELFIVAAAIIAVTLGARVILAVLLIPSPPMGLTAIQAGMTILAYPLIVLISQFVFGVRARVPGDAATGLGRA